ncbi:MAG: hypothetical protein H7177_00450 [Rhizobacter sp.]|nr:hypothetical protein [Bacteriovorax sp.]
MKLIFRFTFMAILLQISSCSLNSQLISNTDYYYKLGCRIFNNSGDLVRWYPGNTCYFEPDGHLLMYVPTFKNLYYIDKDLKVIWTQPIQSHHQINKTKNGDYLILSSELKNYQGKKVRFDNLLRINAAGITVAHFSFYEHVRELNSYLDKNESQLAIYDWDKEASEYGDFEYSHANSFYEISENAKSEKYNELATGNLIVNSINYNRTLILDKDLKTILKVIRFPTQMSHDVQITKDGDFIFFNNFTDQTPPKSRVEIWTYPELKLKWAYQRSSPDFFSPTRGGVQLLEKNLLIFSDFRIDRNNNVKSITSSGVFLDMKSGKELKEVQFKEKKFFQQVNFIELSQFLKNNQGI